MTIPFVGGAPENLSGLNSLVDTIGQIIEPNAKFQHELKALFIQKPELMQQFVDIEKANPGTLKAFGFGDAGSDLLSRMQESIPALKARVLAPKIAEELQKPNSPAVNTAVETAVSGLTPGQQAADDFSAWFSKEGQKLLSNDPELFIRAARAKFGTGTELEQETEKIALSDIHSADAIRNMAPMDVVKKIAGGQLTTEEVSGALAGPRSKAIGVAMQLYADDRNNQMRMYLARYGQQNNSVERAKLASAFDAWQAANGKGSLAGWYHHLWGEDTFGAPLPSDEADIGEALKNQQMAKRTDQLSKMFKAVEPLINAINKQGGSFGSDTQQQNRVDRINDVLKANGSQWRALWDEKGIFNLGKLVFENKTLDITTSDPSALTSEIPPTDTQSRSGTMAANLTGPQRALATQLKLITDPATRAATIQNIRSRAPSPEIAQAIIDLGGGE